MKWRKSDFAKAIEDRGLVLNGEFVDAAVERAADMWGWRELALRHGRECLDDVVGDLMG